jgi:hypothetical protein
VKPEKRVCEIGIGEIGIGESGSPRLIVFEDFSLFFYSLLSSRFHSFSRKIKLSCCFDTFGDKILQGAQHPFVSIVPVKLYSSFSLI